MAPLLASSLLTASGEECRIARPADSAQSRRVRRARLRLVAGREPQRPPHSRKSGSAKLQHHLPAWSALPTGHASRPAARMCASASTWACRLRRSECPAPSPAAPEACQLALSHVHLHPRASWHRRAGSSAGRRRCRRRRGSSRGTHSHRGYTECAVEATTVQRHTVRTFSPRSPTLRRHCFPSRGRAATTFRDRRSKSESKRCSCLASFVWSPCL
jgi:hypothetical protein